MHTHRQPMGRAVQPSGSAWGREEFAVQKLTHTHTPFHAGCCSMKSAHRHVEHEIACVGMEENNALFMFHYL